MANLTMHLIPEEYRNPMLILLEGDQEAPAAPPDTDVNAYMRMHTPDWSLSQDAGLGGALRMF